jgi:hypothetical protein
MIKMEYAHDAKVQYHSENGGYWLFYLNYERVSFPISAYEEDDPFGCGKPPVKK